MSGLSRLRNMFRVPDLRNKILFTIFIIFVFRVGSHIPVPYVDYRAITGLKEASENGALLRVVTELYDQRNNPLFDRLGRHFERVDTWRQAVAEHRLVVAAIAAQDPARARAAMHEHLQRSHDRFGAAWAGGDPAIKPPAEQEAA